MIPRKPAEIISQTSKELEIPEATVDKVVGFFWQEVRKTLVEMKAPNVEVPNLGQFKARGYLLGFAAENCKKYLEKTDHLTFTRAAVRKDIEERLIRIENLKLLYDREKERKKQFKLDKQNGKESKGSLE